jgi:hypothetical protein
MKRESRAAQLVFVLRAVTGRRMGKTILRAQAELADQKRFQLLRRCGLRVHSIKGPEVLGMIGSLPSRCKALRMIVTNAPQMLAQYGAYAPRRPARGISESRKPESASERDAN